jgi:hypothetical protein
VDPAALVQAGREAALDRRAQALAAVGDDQQRGAELAVGEVRQQRPPGVGRLGRARGQAQEHWLAAGVDAPGHQHRLGPGLGMHLEERPVQVQVVDAGARQVAAAPGVELGAQALADPAGGGAADARILPEDLDQHRLNIAVGQAPHPAGDDQGLQRVGAADALAEQPVAQGGVSMAQLRPLHLDRAERGLDRPRLLPAVAVALGRVGTAALIPATPELLTDDLFDDALEGQPHRQPGDLLDDAQQLAAVGEQLVDLGADDLSGRYSWGPRAWVLLRELVAPEGTYARRTFTPET